MKFAAESASQKTQEGPEVGFGGFLKNGGLVPIYENLQTGVEVKRL